LYDDSKDLKHLLYQYECREAYRQYVLGSSKDRASLEALKDHTLISCNTPPEASPLDATTRDDTMREDAPLATSHDMSLLLPRLDTAMPGGFD
jgi:hypothetical protein